MGIRPPCFVENKYVLKKLDLNYLAKKTVTDTNLLLFSASYLLYKNSKCLAVFLNVWLGVVIKKVTHPICLSPSFVPGNSLEKILQMICVFFYLYLPASLTNWLSKEEPHFWHTEVDFGSGLSTGSILMKKKNLGQCQMHGYRCDSGLEGRMTGSCPLFVSVLLCKNKVRNLYWEP